MANELSVTGKQFILEDMHAEANFVSVLAGDEELPVVIHQPANTPPQCQSNGNTLEVSFPQLTDDNGEVFMTDTQKVMVNFVDAVAASRGVQVKLKKD